MAKKIYYDILLDENGDLFPDKGVAIGDCLPQDISQVLRLTQGSIFFAPLVGANLIQYINTNDINGLRGQLKKSFVLANMKVSSSDFEMLINNIPYEAN